jgi:phosphoglucosamine mutase
MARLFGTDGVRGRANADLTPELAMAVAAAAARTLGDLDRTHPPVAVVGRDPRASGEMLEAAVVAGLASTGAIVMRVGVIPTPGLAYLIGAVKADLGVMVSASHNPMPDNGIKIFAAGGQKLPDDVEDAIEDTIASGLSESRPTGPMIGRVYDQMDGVDAYITHLVEAAPNALTGVKVVVDCANGAASRVAPEVYRRAGAEVVAIHAEPDGLNINDGCGSTHIASLVDAVVEHGADLGIAHDGDADRCLAVTADGTIIDGDHIMAILAIAMREAGMLVDDTLVATVMSNLGLKIAMAEHGIALVETKVGDRYVLEALTTGGYSIGGEQSGHVVLPAYATTGDGVLTAVHLMARMAATGKSLAELAAVMTQLPQVLVNVPVGDRHTASNAPAVASAVDEASAQLGDEGRILLRPSGTEPLVRVMVEAGTPELATSIAEQIAVVVRQSSPAAV